MDSTTSATVKRPNPRSIEIPNDKTEIKNALSKLSESDGTYHPGLLYALKSVKNKRSANAAYVLLLGQTGVGKSSTINQLFKGQQITDVGAYGSVTNEILEFSTNLELPELGVASAELCVIDCPGLGDTRGLENDAQFIATLDVFLKDHPHLKDAIPNVVLIIARFDDNRIDGDTSGFVRMLKGIKLLEDRILDKNFSNVVIVLTHFMNGKKEFQTNPADKYELVKRLIREHIGFPEPILVVGAENEPADFELKQINGYYKLPCGEYYPYNILRSIQRLIVSKDPMGQAIIQQAFTCTQELKVNLKGRMKLIAANSSSGKYTESIQSLIGNQFNIQSTEISLKLKEAWSNASPMIRKSHPELLKTVQNIFQSLQMKTVTDIPRTPETIAKLLRHFPLNDVVLMLLEKGLNTVMPTLNVPLIVGQGYCIFTDTSKLTPFHFTDNKPSPLMYKLPAGITCDLIHETSDVCHVVSSFKEYQQMRLTDLGIDLNPSKEMQLHEFHPGYNITEDMEKYGTKLSSLREFREFSLVLDHNLAFSFNFLEDVARLPKFVGTHFECLKQWKEFFEKYGTHVVVAAYGGGSIETKISQDDLRKFHCTPQSDRTKKNQFSKFFSVLEHMCTEVEAGVGNPRNESANLLNILDIKFRGGDSQFHRSNWDHTEPSDATAIMDQWLESLILEPVILETNLTLVPLNYFVKHVTQSTGEDMEKAYENLYKTKFTYNQKSNDSLPPAKRESLNSTLVRSSCLKKGTMILLEDFRMKPVEQIVSGDKILDKDLNSCRVIGCNFFYLGNRKFFGFEKELQFFTEVHVFVGKDMKYMVVSKNALLDENPLFEQIGSVEEMQEKFSILRYNSSQNNVEDSNCQLFTDEELYPVDTPVYFLEVDSPSGTYFANNYLCRHELPPLLLCPYTFICLSSILSSERIQKFLNNQAFTPESLQRLSETAQYIANHVAEVVANNTTDKLVKLTESTFDTKLTAGLNELANSLVSILDNQSQAAFGMLLYAKCGKFLFEFLDKDFHNNSEWKWTQISVITNCVYKLLENEIQ